MTNTQNTIKPIHIIGGGMAGSEAAWQAAEMGVPVILHEMRPVRKTDAHKTDGLAELVCSNSFRSDDHTANAVGVLHQEMRMMNSLILEKGDKHALPAGGALAVDRDNFSAEVTETLESHPLITIDRAEVTDIPADWDNVIIATGPLTSDPLADWIKSQTGEDELAFFDALAPIVHFDSIDMSKAWMQSRYDKVTAHGNGKDYINCPMTKDQYYAFIDALIAAEKMEFKEWEKNTPYFEGCMPIEVMAERGPQTLSFGPMKPVGLTNPHSEDKAYAIVQLRQDNKQGTLFNIVGFGQITGCEGYVESASVGLMVGRYAASERLGLDIQIPPRDTAIGSLLAHITGEANVETFQPMNINFGLMPPMDVRNERGKRVKGIEKKKVVAKRALDAIQVWLDDFDLAKVA